MESPLSVWLVKWLLVFYMAVGGFLVGALIILPFTGGYGAPLFAEICGITLIIGSLFKIRQTVVDGKSWVCGWIWKINILGSLNLLVMSIAYSARPGTKAWETVIDFVVVVLALLQSYLFYRCEQDLKVLEQGGPKEKDSLLA